LITALNAKWTALLPPENEKLLGSTIEEQAAIAYVVLQKCEATDSEEKFEEKLGKTHNDQAGYTGVSAVQTFTRKFVHPLYDFLDERLVEKDLLLNLVIRYKQLVERFDQDRERVLEMFKRAKDLHKKEEDYGLQDMYRFMFLEGVQFHVSPKTSSGRIDFISELRQEGRLLFEAKIFDGDKSYIVTGCHQLYTYLCNYNQPWGGLVIFNRSEKLLSFRLPATDSRAPKMEHNGKTMYMVTIDLEDRGYPSTRGKLSSVEISREDIITLSS
jgi:hypothetical protein